MLALGMDPASPLVRHVIWLPRGLFGAALDGRLVVGGTVEERGFDDTITAGGLLALIEGAWRAVPAIEELPVAETGWAFALVHETMLQCWGRAGSMGWSSQPDIIATEFC